MGPKRFFFTLAIGIMFLTLTLIAAECSQGDFPKKRIELIVPYPPGGITDLTARALSSVLPEYLGQPVVVINKSGGGMLEGGEYLSSRKPDGYTVGLFPPSVGWPEIHFKNPPYKSTDLVPVCKVIGIWQTFIVAQDSKYASVKEVMDDLAKNPSLKILMGTTGVGANPHLTAIAFIEYIGKKDRIVPVPFQGDAGAVKALLGKHIQIASATCTGIIAQAQAGTIRVLAITGEKRWDKLPQVPTFGELGYKFDIPDGENTLYAPKGTPREIIAVLENAIAKTVQHKSFAALAEKAGISIDFKTHDDYLKTYDPHKAILGRFIKELNLLK